MKRIALILLGVLTPGMIFSGCASSYKNLEPLELVSAQELSDQKKAEEAALAAAETLPQQETAPASY